MNVTINKIRDALSSNTNKNLTFKFNGNRNQVEEFNGKIVSTYKSVFIVKPNNNNVNKSFMYTDILIGNLEVNLFDKTPNK